MRLHDYLRRVGVSGSLGPTAETLRRLHVAHREAFLFENLTIREGGPIVLALDALERKFLDDRRGGYCFEHNTLFAAVLRELGFEPVTLLGRVRRGPPERWARTHMVLRVAIDGDAWLADVGFGGIGLLEPMLLQDGATATQTGITYTLKRAGAADGGPHERRGPPESALWILSMRDAVQTLDLYEFSDDPQTAGDVEVANHYTSTHPESVFRKQLTIQRASRRDRIILRGDTLVRYRDGSRPMEESVTPERAREIARDLFDIDLKTSTAETA